MGDSLGGLLATGKTRQAQTEAEQRLRADPNDVEALLTIAKLHVVEGRAADAHQELDRAERVAGPTADSRLIRGNLALVVGDRDRARLEFSEAKAQSPDRPEPHYSLGMLEAQAGKAASAVAELERCVALAPSSAVYRAGLASALIATGARKEAETQLRRALELAPNYVAPHVLLVDLLAADRAAEAGQILRRALEANPNHPALLRAASALKIPTETLASTPPLREVMARILEYHESQAQSLRVDETAPASAQLVALLRARAVARSGVFPGSPREGPAALPRLVRAPSLEGIHVDVPRPELVAERAVDDRLRRLRRSLATFRARGAGEPVQAGDEVLLDLFWQREGQLVPFAVRGGFHSELAADRFTPGVFDGIVGLAVGSNATVKGQGEVQLVVFIREARELQVPAETSPEVLKALSVKVPEAIRDVVRLELERELDALAGVDATNRVLDQLARRVELPVSDAAISAILEALWKVMEQEWLVAYGATGEQVAHSRASWLEHAALRNEVARRIRIHAAVEALAEDKRFTPTPRALDDVLETVGGWMPVPVKQATAQIERNPFRASEYRALLRYLAMLGTITQRATVRFVAAN